MVILDRVYNREGLGKMNPVANNGYLNILS